MSEELNEIKKDVQKIKEQCSEIITNKILKYFKDNLTELTGEVPPYLKYTTDENEEYLKRHNISLNSTKISPVLSTYWISTRDNRKLLAEPLTIDYIKIYNQLI